MTGRCIAVVRRPCPSLLVQIGSVLLELSKDSRILEAFNALVVPSDRNDRICDLYPYFVELTGIAEDRLEVEGLPSAQSLETLNQFSQGADLSSWGKDELFALDMSCFQQNIAPFDCPTPVSQPEICCAQNRDARGRHYRNQQADLSCYCGVDLRSVHEHNALETRFRLAAQCSTGWSRAALHKVIFAAIPRRRI